MRYSLLPALLLTSLISFAQNIPIFEEPLSPRIANYRIEVELLPKIKELRGKQLLLWHNQSEDTIYDLRFHLYLNAFRNNRSTFMRESGGSHRGNEVDSWGYTGITSLRLKKHEREIPAEITNPAAFPETAAMEIRTAAVTYLSPDDGNPHDRTYMMVPLDEPLLPGESIWVEMVFKARLPAPPFARTGADEAGRFFMVAQWFPKIAVWEDGGWTDHQFHANSEFFADFGVYDVWMTVPRDFIVGATGIKVSEELSTDGTRKTHYYHAEDVHDFAWTASPDFIEDTRQVQDVAVRALVHKAHADQMKRHLDATEVAITYFQNNYGDYPFPNLTVVDPAPGAPGAGGMEYPTLITAGTSAYEFEGQRGLEAVIVHEFGHNYWYHLLASNEFEESWLDEGINSYTEGVVMEEHYSPGSSMRLPFYAIESFPMSRLMYALFPDLDKTVMNTWEYSSSTSFGINSYAKPAVFLKTLEGLLGERTMRRILQVYVQRYRFTHPTSQDFIDVANEVSGRDLNEFFEQALYSNKTLDYAVDSATSQKGERGQGFDFTMDMGDGASPEPAEGAYINRVRIQRKGDFIHPVEIQLEFADGQQQRYRWDGRDLWWNQTFPSESRLVSVHIDPNHKVLMDINMRNNHLTVDGNHDVAVVETVRWFQRMQLLFDLLGL